MQILIAIHIPAICKHVWMKFATHILVVVQSANLILKRLISQCSNWIEWMLVSEIVKTNKHEHFCFCFSLIRYLVDAAINIMTKKNIPYFHSHLYWTLLFAFERLVSCWLRQFQHAVHVNIFYWMINLNYTIRTTIACRKNKYDMITYIIKWSSIQTDGRTDRHTNEIIHWEYPMSLTRNGWFGKQPIEGALC